MQGPRTAEIVLEKNKVGGLFKLSTQLCVQDRVHWRKDRRVHRWNRADSPEINPHSYGQLILDKGAKIIQWGKNSLFSKKGNWTFTSKRMGLDLYLTSYKKFTQETSLVVQWLRIRLAGDVGSMPGQETKIPHAEAQLSLWAVTGKSVCLN